MTTQGVDHVVIAVCYYSRNNAYPQLYSEDLAGQVCRYRPAGRLWAHPPSDQENPARLERLVKRTTWWGCGSA